LPEISHGAQLLAGLRRVGQRSMLMLKVLFGREPENALPLTMAQ
jgi:hypothetical protein